MAGQNWESLLSLMDLTIKICKYNLEDGAQFIPIKHAQYVKLKKSYFQVMKISRPSTSSVCTRDIH